MACHFCEDIYARNREQGLPEEESIIYEDENIYVMPDICPLSVGHLLIIAKKHYQGYASADADTLKSVDNFLSYFSKRIGYRNYTLFEHGAVIPYNAGASIDHAHIHIVPVELNMGMILDREFLDKFLCSIGDLVELAKKRQPYLYYKVSNEKLGHVYMVGKIASQYLRNVANQLMKKKAVYDWKAAYKGPDAFLE